MMCSAVAAVQLAGMWSSNVLTPCRTLGQKLIICCCMNASVSIKEREEQHGIPWQRKLCNAGQQTVQLWSSRPEIACKQQYALVHHSQRRCHAALIMQQLTTAH
jgi:hypothetical protein